MYVESQQNMLVLIWFLNGTSIPFYKRKILLSKNKKFLRVLAHETSLFMLFHYTNYELPEWCDIKIDYKIKRFFEKL